MCKLRTEILVNPSVKCNCQCAEVYETYTCSATYCKELYRCTVHFVVYLSSTPTNAHIHLLTYSMEQGPS